MTSNGENANVESQYVGCFHGIIDDEPGTYLQAFLILTKGEGSKNALFERMLFINGPLTKRTVLI